MTTKFEINQKIPIYLALLIILLFSTATAAVLILMAQRIILNGKESTQFNIQKRIDFYRRSADKAIQPPTRNINPK